MTAGYLLDTNILSEPLRPAPNPHILTQLRRYQDQMATAAPVWHELWFGCYRLPDSAKRTAIEKYLYEVVVASIPILPYTAHAAEWHAAERARLALAGRPPSFVDGQIAAIAKANNLTLITFNLADFADFQELSVDDWRR